jgi:two-component system aerobic respiration control sensor histidine kinase ArcB
VDDPIVKKELTVLLVEDTKIAQTVAKIALQPYAKHIDVASLGCQALELFANNHYDLILVDLGLPDMDGIDVARQMLTLTENRSPFIITALTAHSDDRHQKECSEAGIHHYMIKPVTVEKITALLCPS